MSRVPAFKRELSENLSSTFGSTAAPSPTTVEPPPAQGSGAVPVVRHDPALVSHPSLLRSFGFALDGFKYVLLTQRNFRLQITAGLLAVGLGMFCHISAVEWLCLVGISALVLTLEMVNTALETTIDLVTRDYHPLAKIAKDVAAGAVLVASLAAVVIGMIIFYSPLMTLLHHPL